jgi:hypothetical protein
MFQTHKGKYFILSSPSPREKFLPQHRVAGYMKVSWKMRNLRHEVSSGFTLNPKEPPIFFPLYFQVTPKPESYLIFTWNFQFSDASFHKQERNWGWSLCRRSSCYAGLWDFHLPPPIISNPEGLNSTTFSCTLWTTFT